MLWMRGKRSGENSMVEINIDVGTVFQTPAASFFGQQPCGDALCMENYSLPREDMERRLQEISAEYHLDPILDRNIFSLSSGERQLLALASAKTPHQCILLFDEPSASLY